MKLKGSRGQILSSTLFNYETASTKLVEQDALLQASFDGFRLSISFSPAYATSDLITKHLFSMQVIPRSLVCMQTVGGSFSLKL